MFSLGIAVPLDNHKFDKPTFVSAKLAVAASAGATYVDLSPVYPVDSDLPLTVVLKRGDTLTLSSTHTSYSGYTEQVVIEKVTSGTYTRVTFTEPLTYAYLINDSVKGYGSGMAENWIKSSGTFEHTTIRPPGGGYSDDYALYFLAQKSVSGVGQFLWLAHRDFELPYFKEYCWYRCGTMVRGYLTGANTQLQLGFFTRQQQAVGYPSYIYTNYFKPTAENTWEEVSFTNLTAPVLSRYIDGTAIRTDRYGNISIGAYIDAANYSYVWACFDDIYLEHIRGIAPLTQSLMNIEVSSSAYPVSIMVHNPSDFTVGSNISVWGRYNSGNAMEGEIIFGQGKIDAISGSRLTVSGLPAGYNWASGAMVEQKNNGYYVFEEYPDADGVSWEPVSNMSINRTSNNGLKYTNASGWGERTSKVQVNLKFTNVSYTFYRKLKKFEDACKRGELLNLHQDITSQDLPELKQPFVQGFMQLTGFVHNLWDRQKVSFQASFYES